MADLNHWVTELQRLFGLARFRPNQLPIIRSVMAGRDTLAVLATGGGKSLCFQFPASQLPGITVVFSPLISLMADQERAMGKTAVPAFCVNSSLNATEVHRRIALAGAGEIKLLYVAPERLRSPAFQQAMSRVKVSLVVVDEAHCVSEWGHNFRPDYRRIARFRDSVGRPPLLALTATAPPKVREDIVHQLRLADVKQFVFSCDRPNIYIAVKRTRTDEGRLQVLADAVKRTKSGSVIVYVTKRDDTYRIAETLLSETGQRFLPYHGQLSAEEKAKAHTSFMAGEIIGVVATNAFGMGIDKPDIRLVAHAGIPASLEAYYQEIGRAGRDGRPARSVLVYTDGDEDVRRFLLDNQTVTRNQVEAIWQSITSVPVAKDAVVSFPAEKTDPFGTARNRLNAVLVEMEWQGGIRRKEESAGRVTVERLSIPDEVAFLRRISGHFRTRAHGDETRFRILLDYLKTKACRRTFILQYFGEPPKEHGYCCDVCARAKYEQDPYPLPASSHTNWKAPYPAPVSPVLPNVSGSRPVTSPPTAPSGTVDLSSTHRLVADDWGLWFVPYDGDGSRIYRWHRNDPSGSLTVRYGDQEYRKVWNSNPASLRLATGLNLES